MSVGVYHVACRLYVPMVSTAPNFEASRLASIKLVKLDRHFRKMPEIEVQASGSARYFERFEDKYSKAPKSGMKTMNDISELNMNLPTNSNLERKVYASYLEITDKGLSLASKEVSISFWFMFDSRYDINQAIAIELPL